MLLAEKLWIPPEATAPDLFADLADIGARLMVETLEHLQTGEIELVEQEHSQATLAPILKREDGLIDLSQPAQHIYDRWRGFQPWPGAFTTLRGRKLIVHRMARSAYQGDPGEIIIDNGRLFFACGDNSTLEIVELQLEGKKRMTAAEFLNGFQLKPGERLGA
jgi:methionyl-tRNA formyltransferase